MPSTSWYSSYLSDRISIHHLEALTGRRQPPALPSTSTDLGVTVMQVEVAAVVIHPYGGDACHVRGQRVAAPWERVRVKITEDVTDARAGQRFDHTTALPRL